MSNLDPYQYNLPIWVLNILFFYCMPGIFALAWLVLRDTELLIHMAKRGFFLLPFVVVCIVFLGMIAGLPLLFVEIFSKKEDKQPVHRFRFYKDPDNRWYADIPEFPGTKAELEMVAGADNLLDLIAEDSNECHVYFSDKSFADANLMYLAGKTPDIVGANYTILTYENININRDIWLGDVLYFVFDDAPEIIYFKKDTLHYKAPA